MRSYLCTGNCTAKLHDCNIKSELTKAALEQCLIETEAFIRTLEYLTNENIGLKKRLTAVLQRNVNPEFLERAECFHQKFLLEDEAVKIMRHDLILHEEALQTGATNTSNAISRTGIKQMQLRTEMELLEAEFHKLKFSFYNYLGIYSGLPSSVIPTKYERIDQPNSF